MGINKNYKLKMDRIFIEQAKSIRREYIKNAKEIIKCEGKIENYRNELNKIQSELHDEMSKDDLRLKLIDVEKNIKSIENIISPYDKKIKELEKSADKLFENIKERHPDISPEQIQRELIPYLTEITY